MSQLIRRMESQMGLPKPLLYSKQPLPDLVPYAPKKFGKYVEPIAGDLSLYFGLYRKERITESIIVGENRPLVATYCQVRKNPDEVVKGIGKLVPSKSVYKRLSVSPKRKKPSAADAVRFIFLNNFHAMNGDGIADPDNVYAVSGALQNTTLLSGEPIRADKYIKSRDLVFLHPGEAYDVQEFFERLAVRGAYVMLLSDEKEKWHKPWNVVEVNQHRVVRSWTDI